MNLGVKWILCNNKKWWNAIFGIELIVFQDIFIANAKMLTNYNFDSDIDKSFQNWERIHR